MIGVMDVVAAAAALLAKMQRIGGLDAGAVDDDGGSGLVRRRIRLPVRMRGWGVRSMEQPTSLVGTTPLAAAKSLDGLRGRGQELEAAHLRGRAQQMTASHRADERSPAAQEATELLRYGDNGLRESRLRLDGGAALLLQSILPLCMAHLLVLFGGRTCCLHCGKHQAD